MKNRIAIIGISIQAAGADNIEEFWENIVGDISVSNTLSEVRRNDISSRFGDLTFAKGAYLEQIDLFDNNFFRISPAEAERMDPEQRLMLMNVVRAVHNSGHHIQDLKGKRIGIFHTFQESFYKNFFDDEVNISITAHMPGMVGTRVANFMDWRGPVVGFDTACSSALSALYYACESVANGDCPMALVGGVSLGVVNKESLKRSPILSKNEDCRPFDNAADGTLGGEGVFCFLIKNEEDALRDGDPIHAIITGGAINHGGELIQNISAPSPVSQSEVIQMAWRNSGVDPENIRFIEAHGTGTILGDPIEFSGLTAAFKNTGKSGHKCSISSLKGQFGHLNSLAGLAGMTRLLLALKNKTIPAQSGFNKINDHINEEGSPVKVQREFEHWAADNEHPRMGGVSAFGMTGTNVHMVLEEYIDHSQTPEGKTGSQSYCIRIGGKTELLAREFQRYIKDYLLKHSGTNPDNLCYTVNKMTQDSNYVRIIIFKNYDELFSSFNELSFQPVDKKGSDILFLIPSLPDLKNIFGFLAQSKVLTDIYRQGLSSVKADNGHLEIKQNNLLLHYSMVRLLISNITNPYKVISAGSGQVLSSFIAGHITQNDALKKIIDFDAAPFNRAGFRNYLNNLEDKKEYTLIALDFKGEMADELIEWRTNDIRSNVSFIMPEHEDIRLLEIIAGLSDSGHRINMEGLFGRQQWLHDFYPRQFELKRFWPKTKTKLIPFPNRAPDHQKHAGGDSNTNAVNLIAAVKNIWIAVLDVNGIEENDDFFEIGGSSLLGLDILDAIEKDFGVKLEYADIFDYSTILLQAELISGRIKTDVSVETMPVNGSLKKVLDIEHRAMDYGMLVGNIRHTEATETLLPKHILITGTSRLLGTYILKDLLTQTTAKISCLIPRTSNADKMINAYKLYFPDIEVKIDRLHFITGDITEPGLGIAAGYLEDVDAIYHLATNVNLNGKTEISDKINYTGTVNILEWAKKNNVNWFNHFSSFAIAAKGRIQDMKKVNFYETDLDLGQVFIRSIYAESTFKAEKYVEENKGNLKLNVMRIGNIGGDSQRGTFQDNIQSSSLYLRIKTIAEIGYYTEEIEDYSFESTPVDIISKTVVALSLRDNNILSRFHIIDLKPFLLKDIAQILSENDIPIQKTDMDFFSGYINEIMSDPILNNKIPMLGITKYSSSEGELTLFKVHKNATEAYLVKLGIHNGYDKKEYFDRMIKFCINSGFIDRDTVRKQLIYKTRNAQ